MPYQIINGIKRNEIKITSNADKVQHPVLVFVSYQIICSILIGYFLWAIIMYIIQQRWYLFPFPLGFTIVFFPLNIYLLLKIRKYGLFYVCLGFVDPLLKGPPILVKLRDPRAKIRKKSLLEILNSWEKIKFGENFDATSYMHRIIYCLIDRNPEVRRVACEILHSMIFYFIPTYIFSNGLWHKDCIIRTIQDIEFTLLGYLNSDYYLIDKKLKRTILQNGLKNVKLCGNCQCFSLDEPCKSGLEKSPIEGDHSSYSSHEQAEQSFVYINSKKIVGICGVCHLSINEFEELRTCPLCHNMAHREHLLEWVKIKGKCPSCNSNLKEIEIIDRNNFSIGAL